MFNAINQKKTLYSHTHNFISEQDIYTQFSDMLSFVNKPSSGSPQWKLQQHKHDLTLCPQKLCEIAPLNRFIVDIIF